MTTTRRIPELTLVEHEVSVPLDQTGARPETLTVFARELIGAQHGAADLPYLVFLQGGPGEIVWPRTMRPTDAQLKNAITPITTPVRHALNRLRQEGFLTPGPRRQLVAADLSPERRAEIRDVRKALETTAVRTACEVSSVDDIDQLHLLLIRQRRAADAHAEDDFIELDEEMHLAIAAAARLPVVERMLTTIKGFVRVIRLGTARSRDHLYNVLAEHEAIVDAIERRDSDAAVAALMAHLERADYRG